MPHLSILLQTYNQAPYLAASIESILTQTHQDFELLVVDDCSTDDTPSVLRQYQDRGRVTVIRNQQNLGQHRSTNLHMEKLHGEFILFASGDDIYYPRFLELTSRTLAAHPQAGIVHVNGHVIDQGGTQRGLLSEERSLSVEARQLLSTECVLQGNKLLPLLLRQPLIPTHSGCVVRRGSIEKAGPFDESLPQAGDWDMWLRIALHDDIAYLSEPLMGWRRHPDSASATMQTSGQRADDLARLAQKLVSQYPAHIASYLKAEPSILLLGLVGILVKAYRRGRDDLVDDYVRKTQLTTVTARRQRLLTKELALQAWYAIREADDNHQSALDFLKYACAQLSARIAFAPPFREAAAHYWANDAYKAWRMRKGLRALRSGFRAITSSPTYIANLRWRSG